MWYTLFLVHVQSCEVVWFYLIHDVVITCNRMKHMTLPTVIRSRRRVLRFSLCVKVRPPNELLASLFAVTKVKKSKRLHSVHGLTFSWNGSIVSFACPSGWLCGEVLRVASVHTRFCLAPRPTVALTCFCCFFHPNVSFRVAFPGPILNAAMAVPVVPLRGSY